MTDGADAAFTPFQAPGTTDEVDAAVRSTREATFGFHGLDPNRAA
jgi:hypothetical protein